MIDNSILYTMVAADALFLATGAVQLAFALVIKNTMDELATEGEQVARNLLYKSFPLDAGIANAVMIFLAFLVTVPGIMTPTRGWLKASVLMVTISGLFTMCIGIFLWVLTLSMKDSFFDIWVRQNANVQSLMQTSFECCGYLNSTTPAFVTDTVCPSPAASALMQGCSSSLISFSNNLIDTVFTVLFGMVGIDVVLILTIACLLKDRKERERYRHIDEKTGYSGI